MIEDAPKKLDTAHELAALLCVAPATIYSRAKRRLIPFYRLGDRLLFNRDEVLAAIRQGTETEQIEILKKGAAK